MHGILRMTLFAQPVLNMHYVKCRDNTKEAGEKLFLILHGGKSSDSSADLR